MATFSPLKKAEREWIARHLEGLTFLIPSFAPEHANKPISLQTVDCLWDAWIATSPTETDEINAVINGVGVQFGQFLVDDAGFEWTIATDEFGTDLGVRALPDRADVLVYPANFVSKRWERRETGFLAAAFDAIVEQVGVIKADLEAHPKKPWWRFW